MVAVSSIHSGLRIYDKTCLLDVGDHPFIKHPSYLFYRHSAIFSALRLRDGIIKGTVIPRADMDLDVFTRIRDGFTSSTKSRQIPKDVERFIHDILIPKGMI